MKWKGRDKTFTKAGCNSEAQVLIITGGIPSEQYAFLLLNSERVEITWLEETVRLDIKLSINKNRRWGEEEIGPESVT